MLSVIMSMDVIHFCCSKSFTLTPYLLDAFLIEFFMCLQFASPEL